MPTRWPSSAGKGGGDGGHAGRDADRHGQHVVDEQRRRRDEAGVRSDVLLGDDVRAAPARVGVDRLPVGKGDHQQQRGDDEAIGVA